MLQLRVATLAVQLSEVLLTVTVPVGVPLPGAFATTVKAKFTGCPTTDGSGLPVARVVVVLAGLTVWFAPGDVLGAKLPSPA